MDARALAMALRGERERFVRFARRRVGAEADAEDIVQRALLRAAERAASLQDPARARAWFFRILRNTISDHGRSVPADAAHRTDASLEDVADETIVEPGAPCRCTFRLLDALRPTYAEVIRHIDLEGEDPAAAAAALGVSRGNLDVRLHRARKTLRARVRTFCGVSSHTPCFDCSCDGHHRCGTPPTPLAPRTSPVA
jgi:RNA polymerase sigma factor (sigma-70 family)